MKGKYLVILIFVGLTASCARPIAKYSYETRQVEAPATYKFNNESINAKSYFWNFGDGNTSDEENPENRFLLSGLYSVELSAIKGDKINKSNVMIEVKAPQRCLIQVETKFGNMVIELYEDTPGHRDNFVKLVEEGFYEDLLFHRVMEGFMIQGGDPNSRGAALAERLGSGGPGYQIPSEFNESHLHFKGALAAARQPDNYNPEKKSSGSQFYIVHGGTVTDNTLDQMEYRKGIVYTPEQRDLYKTKGGFPSLDMDYTVFGMVLEGLDVIDKIASVETQPGDRPLENVSMKIKVIK